MADSTKIFVDLIARDKATKTLLKSAATLGVIGVAATKLAKDSIAAASNLNETQSKVGVVFGKSASSVLAFGKTAATSLGQSTQQAEEAAATFGNLFVSMKLGQKTSADMSVKLVKLASDLASFNNVDPATALDALRSGLVGEVEPLRKFGVNLNDADLRQRALKLGLTDTTKNVLPPAIKAQAAYSLILEQTKTAQGDFERTSGGLANQQRILSAEIENTQASIGQALLPTLVNVTKGANATLGAFDKLPAPVKTTAVEVGGLALVLGLVLPKIFTTVKAAKDLGVGFSAVKRSLLGGAGLTAALLGIGIVLDQLQGKQADLDQAQAAFGQEGAARYRALYDSLNKLPGPMDRFIRSQHDSNSGTSVFDSVSRAPEVLEKLGVGLKTLDSALGLDDGKWAEWKHQILDAALANGENGQTVENLGVRLDDLRKGRSAELAAQRLTGEQTDATTSKVKDQTSAYADLQSQLSGDITKQEDHARAVIQARQSNRDAVAAIKALGKSSKESGADADAAFLTIVSAAKDASGAVQGTANQNKVYYDSLVRLRNTTVKGSPLRQALDAYIATLHRVPESISTQVDLQFAIEEFRHVIAAGQSAARASKLRAHPNRDPKTGRILTAGGGYFPARPGGWDLTVAEAGRDEVVVPLGPGAVMQGGGGTLIVNIHPGVYDDTRKVARAVIEEFRSSKSRGTSPVTISI